MSTITCDLAIVGLGPAGSAAAITAARQGLHVVAMDKAVFPRDKCCGDGLTTGALRLLDGLGLDPATVPSWTTANEVWVSGPKRKPVLFELPQGPGQFAAITRRSELDAALVDLARSAGSEVWENTELLHVEATERSAVELETSAGALTATHMLAADGMWSPSRKMLGLNTDGYRGEWHAFRQYFNDVSESAASEMWVWFEPDLLPGYVWSFPLAGGSANVGFGIQRGTGIPIQRMKTLWPEILSRPHIAEVLGPSATPEASHKAWPIPARLGKTPTHHGPILFIGDAAAATDPMTGEGIGQALETGIAAVQAIMQTAEGDAADAGRAYARHLKSTMVKDHALAGALSRVLQYPRAAEASVRVAGLTPWTRRNFARWLFEDYARAVVATPRRWHRGMFTGDGSYPEPGQITQA